MTNDNGTDLSGCSCITHSYINMIPLFPIVAELKFDLLNLYFMFVFLPRKQGNVESQPLLQQQQQQLVPVQDNYMQSRAEALQNVESTIHELSNIFTQLATMVSQQGELAIRLVNQLLPC